MHLPGTGTRAAGAAALVVVLGGPLDQLDHSQATWQVVLGGGLAAVDPLPPSAP